jgi:hypothetical protein
MRPIGNRKNRPRAPVDHACLRSAGTALADFDGATLFKAGNGGLSSFGKLCGSLGALPEGNDGGKEWLFRVWKAVIRGHTRRLEGSAVSGYSTPPLGQTIDSILAKTSGPQTR